MSRIANQFAALKKKGRAAFIAYVCAGAPDYDTSLQICRALVRGGADVIELGMPFSDPLADGLTNQLAAQRALESGMTQDQCYALAKAVRAETDIPIIFYTYYNLLFSKGLEVSARKAKESGVDGVLVLDLPPEESTAWVALCREQSLANIFIAAPTTPAARIRLIAGAASGFIYYVSREGVTGERDTLAEGIGEAVSEIKKHTHLPVVVGFGISTAEQVRSAAAAADGVVAGSALVNCIAASPGDPEAILPRISEKLASLLQGLA